MRNSKPPAVTFLGTLGLSKSIILIIATALLSQWSLALAQAKPEAPQKNPFLADSSYSMVHANSAQSDSTVDPGPIGPTRKLDHSELRHHELGMWNLIYLVSSKYADGKRVIWTNGSQCLTKLDYDTFDVIAQLRVSDGDHADTLQHEDFINVFDSDASFDEKLAAAKKSGLPPLDGIYTLLDRDGQYVVAGKGFVRIYGDAVTGDRHSGIVVKAEWNRPKDITGAFMGMNMTFDGQLVLATTDGYLLTLSRDLKDATSVRLPFAEAEAPKLPKGVNWVGNGFSVDEKGGIYVASNAHMHKVVWNGTKLSTDEKDGAWNEPYSNSSGRGSGSTPTVVGFGNESDKLVVITDGDVLMNIVAFWRDEIPEGWKQVPGAPSRRIAGQTPANFGNPELKAAQSEQSVACAGYGMVVVNNEPKNMPKEILDDASMKLLVMGYLTYLKEYQAHGVQKFEWDPSTKKLKSAWVNNDVGDPNGVPFISTGSNMVYVSGARDNQWTLEGIDFTTGKSSFHYILGGARFNSFFSGPQVDAEGRVMVSALYGALRIQPKK